MHQLILQVGKLYDQKYMLYQFQLVDQKDMLAMHFVHSDLSVSCQYPSFLYDKDLYLPEMSLKRRALQII